MAFPDDLEWNQPGVEPTQAKKDEGWKPEEKPPAEYFNWFFNRTSQAVKYLKGESDKLIDDAKIGNRTITDTVTAAAGAGTITNLLSKIGNMIKRITGKSAWYTAPAITLEDASKHTTATSGAHAASAISITAKGDVAATNVQTAIAELAAEKLALAHSLGGAVYRYRDIAALSISATPVTGTMKILLPAGWTNSMIVLDIKGYNSVNGASNWEAKVSGQNTNVTSTWLVTAATFSPNCPATTARLGYDTTAGKCCILLGITTTVWQYPKIVVDAIVGHNNPEVYGSGWSISFITDETGITVSSTPTAKTLVTTDRTDVFAPGGYGVGGSPAVNNVDANNYKSTGDFYFGTGCSNVPTTWCHVHVIGDGANTGVTQIAVSVLDKNMFFRCYQSGVWSPWGKIATLAGGNFTGAINETMVTMASAATMNIGSAAGNLISVTGTTTITAFDTVQAGIKRTLRFASPLTITHNTGSLILPGNTNITVGNGDVIEFASFGDGNWRCTNYHTNGGYAPAGYGLGTTANDYTGNINTTDWKTGFFYVRTTATGTKPYDYGHMIVMVESAASTIKQIWLTNITNDMQIRQCVNGVWSAWKQIATMDAVAPAGYGLGGYATNVTDANLAVLSGFHKINGASSGGGNIPTETGSSTAYIFVEAMDNANVKQTLFNRNNGNIYVRHMFVNVWSAWKQIATTGQIPIMTALIDWSTMATKAGVSSVKNLNNTGSGISAYGGDSGNLGNGDIYLKQSYKNFDAILVVGTNDNADFLMTYKWEKWELEFMFNQQYRFNLFNAGSYAAYWDVWCSKLAGTAHPQSTETVWYNQSQNGGIVEIYGLNY